MTFQEQLVFKIDAMVPSCKERRKFFAVSVQSYQQGLDYLETIPGLKDTVQLAELKEFLFPTPPELPNQVFAGEKENGDQVQVQSDS